MNIAGNAPGKRVATTERFVVGADVEAVHSGDHSGKRLGGDAQHVGVGVIGGFIPTRGAGVDVDGRMGDAIGLGNFANEPAGGAQFGDFHEIVRADGQAQADVLESGGGGDAAIFQFIDITDEGGDGVAEFLSG